MTNIKKKFSTYEKGDEVKEEDDDEVVILEEDGEERPVSSGPPFSRRALEREKMPRLRLLCFT